MSKRRQKDRSHWGDAAFKAMHDKPITKEVLHEALREPTAKELTKSLGFGMAGYVLDDGERLAGRVEKVLDYCERELANEFPGAWASDIKAKLNGE